MLKRSTTSYISLSNTNIGGPVYGGVINVYRDGGFKLYLQNTEVGVDYNNNRARLIFPVSGIDYSLSVPDTSIGSPYFTIPTIIRVNGSNYTSSNGGLIDLGTITTDISGKLNISDTSVMLSPYLRSNAAAATYQPIGSYLTTGTLTDSLNTNGVTAITLNTPNVIFSTPVTFNKTGRSWSGTLSLNNQSANTILAGPSSGSAAAPSFRSLDTSDFGGNFSRQVRGATGFDSSWIDYSGTSSITGWSSFTTKVLKYKKQGNILFVQVNLIGTSNSTSTSFTPPFSLSASSADIVAIAYVENSGRGTSGVGSISGSTATVSYLTSGTPTPTLSVTWTDSGTKRVTGTFFIQVD